MLLQVHEPNQTPAEDATVGIDFGTTHSVVAHCVKGVPTIVPIDGHPLMPSVISYRGDTKVVGHQALASPLASTVYSVKRFLEPAFSRFGHLPFDVVTGSQHDFVQFLIGAQPKSPVSIAKDLLAYIRQKTTETLKKPVYQAVITVPAYYTERARHATRQAATEAGIRVLRLLNEPTAAALAYKLDEKKEGHYLIYDLGGGTFDVSVLYLVEGTFQVLAVNGDTQLGGDDIDEALAQYLREAYDLTDHKDLQRIARSVKEFLADHPQWIGIIQGKKITVSAERLAAIATPFVERTIGICEAALEDAGITLAQIQDVVLVGGSTRLRYLQQRVAAFFEKEPLCSINPDEVVALGAALQAEALVTGTGKLLLDVTPHSLGIETLGGVAEVLIPKNASLPCAVSQKFTTSVDHQTRIKIHVYQGEHDQVKDCKTLARFVLSDIPELPAGVPDLKVTFNLDADGILSVLAEEVRTGIQHTVHIQSVLTS